MKAVLAAAGAAALVLTAIPAAAMGGGQAKMDVCHADGKGDYRLISVAEAAYQTHLDHGDATIGDFVPGTDETKIFDEKCEIVDAPSTNEPVVTPGYSGLTEAAGVRYRGNSSGNEIYLGIPNLGDGNRVEAAYPNVYSTWQDGTYAVTFSFDADENKIVTTIHDGDTDSKTVEYDFDTQPVGPTCPVEEWDTVDLLVMDRLSTGNLDFDNVTLNGAPLGSFDGGNWTHWTVTDFDFSQDFTVSGDLVVSGWTGSELNKLQITVGCSS